jgi:hypothetical protein
MNMLLFIVGILASLQLSTAFGWRPSFSSCHRAPRGVMSSSFCRHGRLWVASSHHNIPTNNSSVETNAEIPTNMEYEMLQQENGLLRETIRQLEMENERLKSSASRIVIENFEGEGKMPPESFWFEGMSSSMPNESTMEKGITLTGEEMESSSPMWCDELDDGDVCPVEPTISFGEALRDRAYWLVGLLVMQSCSGFILAHNELLLEKHPVIIYFLTMLVGAGGNAGNQASVRGTVLYECCAFTVSVNAVSFSFASFF